MMNGVTSVGINTQNYQTAFKAKGSKAAHEVIDQAHDMAKEITRPVAEKKENMIRRYVSKFIEVLGTKKKLAPEVLEENERYRERLIMAAKYPKMTTGIMSTEKARTLLINRAVLTGDLSEISKDAECLRQIEAINEAHRRVYLDELKETDPEMYKEIMMRDANAKTAFAVQMEIAKDFIKNLFKKS